MNEITRIHIAKIPYDIEISAKHEIEKYFKELENYARDKELMQDIEIRITELLAVRGIESNGVIGSDDVEAIKKQLGEPRDFRSDESTEDFENNQNDVPKKKLYRDKEGAILGGVLSGLANYLSVDPLLVRLGFIVLFLLSCGSLLLLYILFWLIIPPARTAIEKIQMTGRTVNLDSIREFNETEADQTNRYQRAEVTRRVISVIFGCIFLAMSVSTLMFTILTAFKISIDTQIVSMLQIGNGWAMLVAFVLSVVAGLLLALLFAVISYSIFTRKFTRKIGISIASIIAMGIVSFASAAGIAMMNNRDAITNQFEKVQISVPENFSKINSVRVNSNGASVKYIVSNNNKITLQTLNSDIKPTININGLQAEIKYSDKDALENWVHTRPIIVVYGPKIDTIKLDSGTMTYQTSKQDLVVIAKGENSLINFESGTFDKLTLNSTDSSSINATNVTANDVTIEQDLNSMITLGRVKSLKITQPETCPSYGDTTTEVKGVLSGNIIYNGQSIGVEERSLGCGSVLIR